MKRDRKNIELTKAVWPGRSSSSVFARPSPLGFHNKFSSSNKWNTLLATLHLDLNADLTHGICNQKVIGSISDNFQSFPSLHFLEDVNEECSLSDDAPNTTHREIT